MTISSSLSRVCRFYLGELKGVDRVYTVMKRSVLYLINV